MKRIRQNSIDVYAADVRTALRERQQKKWWISATPRVKDALCGEIA
jgi:hypothetical protein